jgi:hypothetical protein
MNIAIIILFFSAILFWQLPSIWKKGYKGEVILYLCLILIDIGLGIAQALQADIPIISDWIIYVFKPLKDMVYGSLE